MLYSMRGLRFQSSDISFSARHEMLSHSFHNNIPPPQIHWKCAMLQYYDVGVKSPSIVP